MHAEPPFPYCPCWMCLGNFNCCAMLCGYEVPAVIGILLQTSPLVLWRNRSLVTPWAVGVIRRYQTEISANTPARCRFTPTCSNYGIGALERFGMMRGGWLILKRLARCRHGVPAGTPDPLPRATLGKA